MWCSPLFKSSRKTPRQAHVVTCSPVSARPRLHKPVVFLSHTIPRCSSPKTRRSLFPRQALKHMKPDYSLHPWLQGEHPCYHFQFQFFRLCLLPFQQFAPESEPQLLPGFYPFDMIGSLLIRETVRASAHNISNDLCFLPLQFLDRILCLPDFCPSVFPSFPDRLLVFGSVEPFPPFSIP